MKNTINRICIIGGYHIDGINYYKNWEQRDKAERDEIILEKIEEQKWVMDGTYNSTLYKRLEKSDLIIFLDYSTFALLKGILGRFFKYKGRERQEIPGCNEKISTKFILWVIKWRKNKRKKILEEIKKVDNEKVLIFKNRNQLNRWFINEFNTKIEIN